jgi:hypothetical protein
MLPDGTRLSRNNYQDEQNMARLGKGLEHGLTGYPPEVQEFEQKVNDMQAQLSTLPPSEHEAYAGALATLDVAFRDSTDADVRRRSDEQLSQLGSALLERSTAAGNDPVQQTLGVFNDPVGAGLLTQPADQHELAELTRLRGQFVAASTPVSRQASFAQAAELKSDLQRKIASAIDQHTKQEDGKWAAANADVDRIIDEADGIKDNPGKRYELIGRQLFSSNPGSGTDDFADRRLLAFTQRMKDDPALRDKLTAWSVEAGQKLNGYGVDAQKNYLDVLNNLPPAGSDYVRDLADQYNAVLKDSSYKDYSITPRARGEKLATQIIEGAARFLMGMTPFAPLTAVLDAHSSLSANTRLGIDLAAGALGLVAGEGAAAFSERLAAKGAGAADDAIRAASGEHPPGDPVGAGEKKPAALPGSSAQPGNAGATGAQGGRSQSPATQQGFVVDPAVAEASQRIDGTRPSLPDDYAVQPAPGSLKPAAGQKGVLTDNQGNYYIANGGKTYPARFDRDNGTWRVLQADNPYRPQYPVRLDAQGNWQIHNDVGLKGGMDPAGAGAAGHPQDQPFGQACRISTSTGKSPSVEMQQTLDPQTWRSPANRVLDDERYIRRYKAAFDRLRPEQKEAIRNWTHLDSDDTASTDSSQSGYSTDGSYENINYELNRELRGRHHEFDTNQRKADLQTGLAGLPRPDGESRLIRVSHVPGDYASKFAPGDYVTNSPAFMSAASHGEYIQADLADSEHLAARGAAYALYDIKSQSATPFIHRVTTLAPGENEWLFRPNTVFRVEEIATATSSDGSAPPRIGVRLVEVPITTPTYAKNIHTGEMELVYPSNMTPTYAPLQPTKTPSLRVPSSPSPDMPPQPTHGNPNQPGPSGV